MFYQNSSPKIPYQPTELLAQPWFTNCCVLLFTLIDLFCLKTLWNQVLTENPLYIWGISLVCAVALDVPLSLVANTQRRYEQNLISVGRRNLITILGLSVFSITFALSLAFRLNTAELTFDVGTGSTLSNTVSSTSLATATGETDTILFLAALFNGMIPLLTSISSFVLSYYSADPLRDELIKAEKDCHKAARTLVELEKEMAKYPDAETITQGLLKQADMQFNEEQATLDSEAVALKLDVRQILAESMNTPEQVETINEDGQRILYSITDYTAGQTQLCLADEARNNLMSNTKVYPFSA